MSSARPNQMTPHMRRAAELLADGEWHDRESIIMEMGKAIPPGQAIRFQEQIRSSKRKTRVKQALPVLPVERRIVPRENNTLITMGRRAMSLKALHTARRVEQEKRDDGKIYVRLRPVYGRNMAPPNDKQPSRARSGESESRTP